MHQCAPPGKELDAWLEALADVIDGHDRHLSLQQVGRIAASDLRPYFESAHADARKHIYPTRC